jgi:hypothetical protein
LFLSDLSELRTFMVKPLSAPARMPGTSYETPAPSAAFPGV